VTLNVGRKNKNRILASLSKDDTALLTPLLAPVEMPVRKVLEARNRRIEHVYFLGSGMASVVANGGNNHSIEIAVIGNEGMTGFPVLMGTDRSPNETFMQIAGAGWRIAAADLRAITERSASLRNHLLQYGHAQMVQMGFTALSNGRYKLDERAARWLLMAHDRSDSDDVALTHELLALMLGTRRPGITLALSELEKKGLISAKRGVVTVLDREGLEEIANASYGAPEAEYARLFGET
jgi:CRP-like cAMP-binding protein